MLQLLEQISVSTLPAHMRWAPTFCGWCVLTWQPPHSESACEKSSHSPIPDCVPSSTSFSEGLGVRSQKLLPKIRLWVHCVPFCNFFCNFTLRIAMQTDHSHCFKEIPLLRWRWSVLVLSAHIFLHLSHNSWENLNLKGDPILYQFSDILPSLLNKFYYI